MDIKPEEKPDNGKAQEGITPLNSNEFKIAEIWIRNNEVELDAVEGFLNDKIRAIGILDYCKDIVKKFKPPKSKIFQPKGNIMDFVRKIRK